MEPKKSDEPKKQCACTTPTPAQAVLLGYRGKLTCTTCGGIFNWPLPEKKYEGDDPVEEMLFNLTRDKNGLTLEAALLTMLLRIEAQLREINEGKKKR